MERKTQMSYILTNIKNMLLVVMAKDQFLLMTNLVSLLNHI